MFMVACGKGIGWGGDLPLPSSVDFAPPPPPKNLKFQ